MFFVVAKDYSTGVNGHRVEWLAGDVVEIELDDIGPLVRDAGPDLADWSRPLTAEQAGELRRKRDEANQAQADQDTDRDRQEAVSGHVRVWGGWVCPGAREAPYRPFGTAIGDIGPHHVAELDAAQDPAGGWVVACPQCLAALTDADGTVRPSPNLPPPQPDRTSRRYRVGHRYAAEVDGKRVELPPAGEVVELPVWLGQHIRRDSPGALRDVDG